MEKRNFQINKNNILNIFGLGKTPFSASSTSLLSVLIFLLIENFFYYSLQIHFSFASVIFLWSIIEATKNSEFASSDSKEIVIDEFLGMYLCCLISHSESLSVNFILLILFRIIDILKPFPFSAIEKKLAGKYGFLWDDIIIGIVIGTMYRILIPCGLLF